MKKRVRSQLKKEAGKDPAAYRQLKKMYNAMSWIKKTKLVKELMLVNN